ncbi:Hypothetical predicted protein, partial [Pelobates cultripes]
RAVYHVIPVLGFNLGSEGASIAQLITVVNLLSEEHQDYVAILDECETTSPMLKCF